MKVEIRLVAGDPDINPDHVADLVTTSREGAPSTLYRLSIAQVRALRAQAGVVEASFEANSAPEGRKGETQR